MKVSFLGTGASHSGGSRLNTSLVIQEGGSCFMVDCSGTPEYSLKRANIDISQIDDLFLTHYHIDHIYALPSLVQVKRLLSFPKGGAKLRLYGNPDTLAVAEKLIDLFSLREKHKAVDIEFNLLEGEEGRIRIGKADLEYFQVDHGGFPALGFCIRNLSCSLVYSGDSMVCPSVMDRLTPDTWLIHDCAGLKGKRNHSDVRELARALQGKAIRKLILVHLPDLTAREEERMNRTIRESNNFDVYVPADGETISI
jgi:ribonuclease Z